MFSFVAIKVNYLNWLVNEWSLVGFMLEIYEI